MKSPLIVILLLFHGLIFGQNNCLDFDGLDDYVRLNGLATPLSNTDNFTIETTFRFYAGQINEYPILIAANRGSGNLNRFVLRMSGGQETPGVIVFNVPEQSGDFMIVGTIPVNDENCHHVAVTYDNGMIRLYIDGIPDGTLIRTINFETTDRFSLGQEYDEPFDALSQLLKGTLENTRFWTVTRTQQQIQGNLSSGIASAQPGLLASFLYDQGNAGLNNTSITQIVNSAGTAANGDLMNFSLQNSHSNFIQTSCGFGLTINNGDVCPGECMDLSVTASGNNSPYTYVWSNGISSDQSTVEVCPSVTTTYMVTVTNALGESQVISSTVTVNTETSADLLGDDTVTCDPDLVLNPGTFDSYLWNNGNATQQLHVTDFGTYWVEVENSAGCIFRDTLSVFPGNIDVDLGPDQFICSDGMVTLSASPDTYSFIWQDGSNAQDLDVFQPGTYYVDAYDGQCHAADTMIVQEDFVNVNYSVDDTVGCDPVVVSFSGEATSLSDIVSWHWTFADSESFSQNTTVLHHNSGAFPVSLEVISFNGCTASASGMYNVTVYESPNASFDYSPDQPDTGEEITFINTSSGETSWSWIFSDTAVSSLENPVFTFHDAGTYNVILLVSNELCTDETVVSIRINGDENFYIPNSFTPDGDEYNQLFIPVFSEVNVPSEYNFCVYDRWGERIFETSDIHDGWDGTYKGLRSQDGAYTWTVRFGTETETELRVSEYNGHVILLR